MIVIRSREDFEKMSVEELVKEQQALMRDITRFENKYILKTNKKDSDNLDLESIVSPSPTVVWRIESEKLLMITKIIDEKTRNKYGIGIDF